MVSSVKALDAVCVFVETPAQNFVLQSNKSYRIKPTMKPISSTPATHHVNPIINIERTRGEQWYKMTVARSYFIACYTRSRNRSTVGVRVITNYMNGRGRVATA